MTKVRRSIVMQDDVWRSAKSAAALAGITLSDYIEGLVTAGPFKGDDGYGEIEAKPPPDLSDSLE